jgi:hypothetical protein
MHVVLASHIVHTVRVYSRRWSRIVDTIPGFFTALVVDVFDVEGL